MKNKNMNEMSYEEIHEMVEAACREYTKHWTPEDFALQLEAMKNISERPIWNAIYQAKKWALIESRASVVKIESEEERKAWFDRQIEQIDNLIEQSNAN